jgi:hypothetical protein
LTYYLPEQQSFIAESFSANPARAGTLKASNKDSNNYYKRHHNPEGVE